MSCKCEGDDLQRSGESRKEAGNRGREVDTSKGRRRRYSARQPPEIFKFQHDRRSAIREAHCFGDLDKGIYMIQRMDGISIDDSMERT